MDQLHQPMQAYTLRLLSPATLASLRAVSRSLQQLINDDATPAFHEVAASLLPPAARDNPFISTSTVQSMLRAQASVTKALKLGSPSTHVIPLQPYEAVQQAYCCPSWPCDCWAVHLWDETFNCTSIRTINPFIPSCSCKGGGGGMACKSCYSGAHSILSAFLQVSLYSLPGSGKIPPGSSTCSCLRWEYQHPYAYHAAASFLKQQHIMIACC